MKIIHATADHIPAIRKIVDKTWPDAYGAILGSGQIAYMIGQFYSKEVLTAQMEAGHPFLLAVNDDEAVGFAGYEAGYEPGITKLHKLYVLPEMQGTGLGKMLLMRVVEAAAANGQQKIILNVNRYNKALNFYQKAGFAVLKEDDIDIGSGYFMNDYVLVLDLG